VKNASVFGKHAKFTWDAGNPYTVVILPSGPVKPADRRLQQNFIVSTLNGLTLTFYDPNAINIYFSGYIPHPTDIPEEETLAYTIDPGDTDPSSDLRFHRPFILFNDGDWNGDGHTPAPTNELILEHEVGHYLIRGKELNDYYILNHDFAVYDSYEHFMAWPSDVDTDTEKKQYRHLMKSGDYLPLFLELDPASKENAYDRFYDNKWQQP
jgi:hypothetical protein